MLIYAGIYYVFHTENIGFRTESRTFHGGETYGSHMQDIENIPSCDTIPSSVFTRYSYTTKPIQLGLYFPAIQPSSHDNRKFGKNVSKGLVSGNCRPG